MRFRCVQSDGISPALIVAIGCSARHSGRALGQMRAYVTKGRSMSKKPSVKSDYHAKKDRLEITIKNSGLKKKSERKDLIKHLEHSVGKAKGKRRKDDPYKQTKIPEVGD
jgi:hypothetical protein